MNLQYLTTKELKDLNIAFWLFETLKVKDREFYNCIQRDDLDIITIWIKFFNQLKEDQKQDFVKQIEG